MRIYNRDKTIELTNYDLTKGYLQEDKLFIAHHDAIAPVAEAGHYETIAEYANGGKDVEWVIDMPAIEGREAFDEYEDILVYIPFTTKELAAQEIAELKIKLANTDYQAIKYAEGALTAEEYAPIKAQRQEWRDRINALEEVQG